MTALVDDGHHQHGLHRPGRSARTELGLPRRRQNLSPHLAWNPPPAGTAELLLLIEDLDAPIGSNPAVHCLAVIDETSLPTPHSLPAGALAKKKDPAPGVTLLRSVFSRGYYGPEPLKGHGPHRYVFQIYALGLSIANTPNHNKLLKTRPRTILTSIKHTHTGARPHHQHLPTVTRHLAIHTISTGHGREEWPHSPPFESNDRAACDVGECGHAEVDGLILAPQGRVDLGELVLGAPFLNGWNPHGPD